MGSFERSNQGWKLLCRTRYMLKDRLKPQGMISKILYHRKLLQSNFVQCVLLLRSLTVLSTDLKVTGHSKRNKLGCLQQL